MSISNWVPKHPEVRGLLWLFFASSQLLSLCTLDAAKSSSNFLGLTGHWCALLWLTLLGLSSFIFLAGLIWHALCLCFNIQQQRPHFKLLALTLACSSLSLLMTLGVSLWPKIDAFFASLFHFSASTSSFHCGGMPAYHLFDLVCKPLFSVSGTAFFAITLFVCSLCYFLEFPWQQWLVQLKERLRALQEKYIEEKAIKQRLIQERLIKEKSSEEQDSVRSRKVRTKISTPPTLIEEPPVDTFYNIEKHHPLPPPIPKKPLKTLENEASSIHNWALPSLDLLNPPKKSDQGVRTQELKQKAALLEETLLSFGIEAKVGQVHCGPTIASFEVHPAVGVKIGKITTLEHDIALNLEAKSIRIIAPIPGKAAVGIEVPHNNPQEISFKELLSSYLQQGSQLRIPMLLGKAVNGDLVISDLTKMPHCIIAGATGSGKSVCLNSIVISILMTATPEQIRLLMIDPKKVELTPYSELPHMLAPVITEPHTACSALQWLVKEMEKRYEILKITGQRNIEGFNRRQINEEVEKASFIPIPRTFAYYVAIVDELADLMMVASQDIETPIARIAQMARAVGIHLILATQRPSREVITGLIRANFPARIAFKVASRINSQIILDETGAETLLGNGDMLFLQPGGSQLLRAQGAFIRDEEITRVIEHLTKQAPPQYLISSFEQLQMAKLESDDEAEDSFYGEAKSIVLSTGNASTTFLQRKLKIGYARAASLMDMLEQRGIVGPQDGSKARKVFFGKKEQSGDDFEDPDQDTVNE